MDLWIRSQDKRILQKVDNVFLDANYENKRICNYADDYKTELGTYKTKERALEVLDEIQNFICIEIHENNINYEKADLILKGKIVDSLCKVYQMPEK